MLELLRGRDKGHACCSAEISSARVMRSITRFAMKIFGSPDVELAVIEGRCELVLVSQPVTVGFIVDDLGPDQLVVIERSALRNFPAILAVISTITGVPLPRVVREI